VGNSFELLPLAERVQQYREMADATFLKVQKTEDLLVRTRYLDLATQWHALAQQLEAGMADPEALTGLAPPEADRKERRPDPSATQCDALPRGCILRVLAGTAQRPATNFATDLCGGLNRSKGRVTLKGQTRRCSIKFQPRWQRIRGGFAS